MAEAGEKSTQDVYEDAYLKPKCANPTADSVPDDVRKRIRRVGGAADATLVRAELDQVLGRFEHPARPCHYSPGGLPPVGRALGWSSSDLPGTTDSSGS